jgi:hypothetical protein
MKYRKLRIAWSVGWGLLAVLLCVLWVRSYQKEDRASGRISSTGVRLYSSRGWLVCFRNSMPGAGPYDWDIDLGTEHWLSPSDGRLQFSMALGKFLGPAAASHISIPHWLAIVVATSTGLASWLHWRFSLRTLLIATTLVAVGLGLIVSLR